MNSGMLIRRILLVVGSILITSLLSNSALACTVFTYSKGDKVLFGNVENEQPHYKVELHFIPPKKAFGEFGHFLIFYNGNVAGGINDQGLCFDVAALPDHDFYTGGKTARDIVSYILKSSTTVDDALEFFSSHYWVGHRVNHLMITDKSGASAVVEHIGSTIYIFNNYGSSQVMTNYSIADPEIRYGDYPCPRYEKATDMLKNMESSVDNMQDVCFQVSQAYYPALYATIYDLNTLDIHVFNANAPGHFRTTFNLVQEYSKGSHHYILKDHQIIPGIPEKSGDVFSLSANYPNPFSGKTSFTLEMAVGAFVNIDVLDFQGRIVDNLRNENLAPGSYSFYWHSEDLPAGIYYCRCNVEGIIETRKWLKH
jgi:hypothetical protein